MMTSVFGWGESGEPFGRQLDGLRSASQGLGGVNLDDHVITGRGVPSDSLGVGYPSVLIVVVKVLDY
jgi:hypothetical protein